MANYYASYLKYYTFSVKSISIIFTNNLSFFYINHLKCACLYMDVFIFTKKDHVYTITPSILLFSNV